MTAMFAINDRQLRMMIEAARDVPAEKRSLFLMRVAAMTKFRSHSDDDVREVLRLATAGLIPHKADTA